MKIIHKDKYTGILVILLVILSLSGCAKEMIFEENKEAFTPIKVDALDSGEMYVKDGTDFYRLFEPDASFSSEGASADASRMIWTLKEEDDCIPVLFPGEPIIIAAGENAPAEITLERFKDIGYSIGVCGMRESDNGMLEIAGEIKKRSQAEKRLIKTDKNGEKETFSLIETVSGKKLTMDNVSSCGTITGLKEGKSYQVGAFSGSKYLDTKLKADTHIYQSSETVSVTKVEMTKNGYIAIDMPKDLKGGYYYIFGAGMFLYKKGENLNEPNEIAKSRAVDDTLTETSRSLSYEAEKDYESLTVRLSYSESESHVSIAYLKRPDGEKVEMKETVLEIQDAKKGTYTLFLKGKNIDMITADFSPGIEVTTPVEEEKEEVPKISEEKKESSPKSTKESAPPPVTVYEQVPVTDPLNAPEISGTIGD